MREYSDRPISDESLQRILEAGRATGSSQNRQPWKFYVVRDRDLRLALADAVYAPSNLSGCQVAIAVVLSSKASFDAGRCAEHMMLAAWAEGIGSVPNGVRDAEQATQILKLPDDAAVGTILSLGYPLHPHTPRPDDVEGILRRVKRKPLNEVVEWVG